MKITNATTAFTTGAFISPIKINDVWCWVIDDFDNDSFISGDAVYLLTESETVEGLVGEDEEILGFD